MPGAEQGRREARAWRLFVLDDDAIILSALRRSLARRGAVHASTEWREVANALVRAPAEPWAFRALVCDLEMPSLRGDAFCRIARKHLPELTVVLFTAVPEQAPPGVADAVVPKSASVSGLVAQLERLHLLPRGEVARG